MWMLPLFPAGLPNRTCSILVFCRGWEITVEEEATWMLEMNYWDNSRSGWLSYPRLSSFLFLGTTRMTKTFVCQKSHNYSIHGNCIVLLLWFRRRLEGLSSLIWDSAAVLIVTIALNAMSGLQWSLYIQPCTLHSGSLSPGNRFGKYIYNTKRDILERAKPLIMWSGKRGLFIHYESFFVTTKLS